MKKPIEKYKAKCGRIAISIEGDYTIIVEEDLNKSKYHKMDYDIHIHNKKGVITINIYKSDEKEEL